MHCRHHHPTPFFFVGIYLSTSYFLIFGGNIGGRVIAYKEVNLIIFTLENPEICKYISEDENNYEHCGNDPINFNNKINK